MTVGLCRHGIPYGQHCQACLNHRLYWKWRNAGGIPKKKAGTRPADPPGQEGQKP